MRTSSVAPLIPNVGVDGRPLPCWDPQHIYRKSQLHRVEYGLKAWSEGREPLNSAAADSLYYRAEPGFVFNVYSRASKVPPRSDAVPLLSVSRPLSRITLRLECSESYLHREAVIGILLGMWAGSEWFRMSEVWYDGERKGDTLLTGMRELMRGLDVLSEHQRYLKAILEWKRARIHDAKR